MPTVTVDRTSQRYSSGPQERPRCVGLHTTEGGSWPSYGGGGYAPHSTIKPLPGVGIQVREHIDFDDYGRAFENRSGGVETNTAGVIQFELVGTCDERQKGNLYYWPDADDAVLEALADYLRPIMGRYGIPLRSTVTWKSYNKGQRPSSYGLDNGVRLTGSQWLAYRGILGHQHVPENNHGDPGDFPIARLLRFLGASSGGAQDVPWTPPKPKRQSGGFTPLWTPTGKLSVREIQKIVGATVDGLYGAGTLAKVKAYQRDELRVTADGYWGADTERAHFRRERKAKRPRLRNLKRGSRGRRVRNLQAGLNRAFPAYSSLAVDGIFGRGTRGAVMEFQRRSGLVPDGIVGPRTRKALARYGIKA